MSRSREQIEEYLLVAYLSGHLPERLRKEISAYLAQHAEARELLALAQEALDVAADDPIFNESESDEKSIPASRGDGDAVDRSGDGATEAKDVRVREGGLHRIRPGRVMHVDSERVQSDADTDRPGSSLDTAGYVRSSDVAIWRITSIIAAAVLVIAIVLSVHLWSVASDTIPSNTGWMPGVEIIDAAVFWPAMPDAESYRVMVRLPGADSFDEAGRTQNTRISIRDSELRLPADETIDLYVMAVSPEGNVLGSSGVIRIVAP